MAIFTRTLRQQVAVDLRAARSQKIYRSPFGGPKNLFPRDLSRRVADPRGGQTQTRFESKLSCTTARACHQRGGPPGDCLHLLLHPRCGATPIWSFFRTPSIRTKANPDVATCEWRCHFVGRSAAIPPHLLHPHDSGTPRKGNHGNIDHECNLYWGEEASHAAGAALRRGAGRPGRVCGPNFGVLLEYWVPARNDWSQ